MTPEIDIYRNAERDWVTEDMLEAYGSALQQLLPTLLQAAPGPDHVLSTLDMVEISVVDDETIAQIHGEFLNDPTPTDAITFPYGEIIVSCDTAERYAQEHGLSREEELFRYMVHGLTHLHGYLDYEPADREALFAVQEPLVARFFPLRKPHA
ncbi:MAG: rRNA maturation RNase YbeY [Akkermansia sp.]|nr:rRNA maturation RNase YbeY [Akkermansia sp.]